MAKSPPTLGKRSTPRKWGTTSRASRQARGYGREWELTRDRILIRDRYLCQPCLKEGRTGAATQVDHVKPRAQGGSEADDNLQAICDRCHRAKTAREGQAGHR